MLYRKDRNGNELSMLGFGCMRFTRKGNGIDLEKAERVRYEDYQTKTAHSPKGHVPISVFKSEGKR